MRINREMERWFAEMHYSKLVHLRILYESYSRDSFNGTDRPNMIQSMISQDHALSCIYL